MLFLLFYILITFLGTPASCTVQVAFTLDEQLPLIARVQKPYTWAFSSQTFSGSPSGPLNYSASNLPSWLSFDPESRRFYGTPSHDDAGTTVITVSASQAGNTARSSFTLCVVTSAAPEVSIPLAAQLAPPRSSLSSVFALAEFSALSTGHPALRIPPRWSFSIGLELETLACEGDVFYDIRQSDGSYLPTWMTFNFKELTLNGVVPNETIITKPTVFALNLIASDLQGYTAEALPFDIVIAPHEVSMKAASLPTIGVPRSSEFRVPLKDTVDFSGILLDGKAIGKEAITDLLVDVTGYPWLRYDSSDQILSGTLPQDGSVGDLVSLPFQVNTIYGQTLRTLIAVAPTPTIFVQPHLPPLQGSLGEQIDFDLRQFFSNSSDIGEIDVVATFEPVESSLWLAYNAAQARLTGRIPSDFRSDQVNVTFAAHSRSTHSSGRAQLSITVSSLAHPNNGVAKSNGGSWASEKRRRLVLGLSLTFGLLGGFCVLGILLAIVRKCARVPDTALNAEEGKVAWTEQEKQWYGLSSDKGSEESLFQKIQTSPKDNFGFDLRRVSDLSQMVNYDNNSGRILQSPGVMIKKNFRDGLQRTVRIVSNKFKVRTVSQERPVISRPIASSLSRQISTVDFNLPFTYSGRLHRSSRTPAGTVVTNSPSSSTGAGSIPIRRPDFSASRPSHRSMASRQILQRQNSTESAMSHASVSTAAGSMAEHSEEGVIQLASRARSANSSMGQVAGSPGHARIVPFMGANTTPTPETPEDMPETPHKIRRVPSQKATVYRKNSTASHFAGEGKTLVTTPRPLTPRSAPNNNLVFKIRSGESFRYNIPLTDVDPLVKEKSVVCRLPNGEGGSIPAYLKLETNTLKANGNVELHGRGPSGGGHCVVEIGEEGGPRLKTVTVDTMVWRR